MPNIERKVILDVSQPDQALVQLRATLRAPDQQIAALVDNLKELENAATKLVSTGIEPTRDGLVKLSAQFKTSVQDAAQLAAAVRDLAAEQQQQARSIQGSAEAQAAQRDAVRAELAERRVAAQQIAAAQEDVTRRAVAEADLRRSAVQQISAEQENVKRQAQAETEVRRVGLQQVAAAQEDVNRRVREETEQRRLARLQIQATRENLQVAAQQQFLSTPVNQIDAFNRAMLGGAEGVRRFQEQQVAAQQSARVFSSVLFSQPILAARTLATDSRAAGAAMAFLKAQLDFVINSRFGTIALGFAFFGTAIATIKSLTTALVQFEQEFSRIQALSTGQANAAQINARAQTVLRDAALQTGTGLSDLTGKFREALQATSDINVAQALFTNALRLSLVAGTDFGQTLTQLSGVFNVFQSQLGPAISAEDKLRLITSQLFAAFGEGRARPDDFIQAIKFVGSQAALSHIPLTRLLGIISVLGEGFQEGSRGGRGLSQALSTISDQAEKFNQRFALGLTEGQITESPLLAIDEILKRLQDGRLSISRFKAEITTLLPQNAERIILTFTQLADQTERFEKAIRNAQDIARLTDTVLTTTGVAFRQLGSIALEAFIAAAGGAEAFRGTMQGAVQVAGFLGSGVVLIATAMQLATASAVGLVTVLSAMAADILQANLRFEITREAAKLVADQITRIAVAGDASAKRLQTLGNEGFKAALGFEELRKKGLEAEEAFRKQAQSRIAAGGRGIDLTARQRIELALSEGQTVSLERRLAVQRENVAVAEVALRTAFKTETQERAFTTLLEERKRLRELETSDIRAFLDEQQLANDRLTEANRNQATTTAAFAQEEVRARRGIIFQIQQQQAAVEQLVAAQRISAQEGQRLLIRLERDQVQQVQAIRQVQEAARTSLEAREEASRKVERAEERLRRLVREQADQRADAESRVINAREQVRRAIRDEQEERRKSLEEAATGRARLALGFPEAQQQLITEQVRRLRAALQIANLPLKERISLLEKELDLIGKLRADEEKRLEAELLFGQAFPAVVAAQRQAAQALLTDPARRAAAERLARLRGMAPTEELLQSIVGRPFGLTSLPDVTAEERRKQIDIIGTANARIVELEQSLNDQLKKQAEDAAEREKKRSEAIRDATVAREKAIREQAQLLQDQARAEHEANRELQKAIEEKRRLFSQLADVEAERTRTLTQSVQGQRQAFEAQRSLGFDPDIPESAKRSRFVPAGGFPPVEESPLTTEELRRFRPTVEIRPRFFTNIPGSVRPESGPAAFFSGLSQEQRQLVDQLQRFQRLGEAIFRQDVPIVRPGGTLRPGEAADRFNEMRSREFRRFHPPPPGQVELFLGESAADREQIQRNIELFKKQSFEFQGEVGRLSQQINLSQALGTTDAAGGVSRLAADAERADRALASVKNRLGDIARTSVNAGSTMTDAIAAKLCEDIRRELNFPTGFRA